MVTRNLCQLGEHGLIPHYGYLGKNEYMNIYDGDLIKAASSLGNKVQINE